MDEQLGPGEGWRNKIWPKPKPKPEPGPAPTPDEPLEKAPAAFVRAWLLLRSTKIETLRAVFTFVPMTVFFALTGIVVWLILLLRAAIWFIKAVVT